MIDYKSKNVAIIVAHPDDETLWAGGTILNHPFWKFFIVCLSRKNDVERATKFKNALKIYKSDGIIGDLDDGEKQLPLKIVDVEKIIMDLLPNEQFDIIITHNPNGEYTKHLRHEEVAKAVINLWKRGDIKANELWLFAYEDGNGKYFPKPIENASIYELLLHSIWKQKYNIITNNYGFAIGSWEAQTTPEIEAYWQFTEIDDYVNWLQEAK